MHPALGRSNRAIRRVKEMQTELGKFWRRGAVRAVGTMALSSALGQAAILCVLPILTRLYEPAAFGLHSMFMAFVGIATVGICLCMEHRIVSTADDAEADNVFAAALMCIPVTTLLATGVLSAMIYFGVAGYKELPGWCVPAMTMMLGLNGIYSACRCRVVRQQDYDTISRNGLTQNLARAAAPLLLYPVAPFWLGLTGGELAGRSVGVRGLARRVLHRRMGAPAWRDPAAWWALLQKEHQYSAVLLGTVLVDATASQLVSPLLASTYGATAAGQYFLVALIIVAPSALIGAGAADVIHAKGAQLFHADRSALPAFARRSALALLAASLAIFVPIYWLAPYVLPHIFGAKWPHVDEAVQAMTPFAIVGFVASPCARLLASINRMNLKVLSDAVRLIGVPVTILFSHMADASFLQALWNLSWFLAAAYFLYFLLTYISVVRCAKEVLKHGS